MEFAHKEGFTRSEQDVTVQRVVTAVSAPIKKAFGDFSYSPILAISLFAELGSSPEQDVFFVVDFDGDYHLHKNSVILSGRTSSSSILQEAIPAKTSVEKAIQILQNEWMKLASLDGEQEVSLDDLTPEIMLMERNSDREDIFRKISS